MSQVWIGCTDDAPKGANSLMVFYVLDGNESHLFFYRRMGEVEECLKAEREYLKMVKGAKTVRIVGDHPTESTGPQKPMSQRIPARFVAASKEMSWFFQRFQVGDKCKSYFEHTCDLPKNYWADTIPE